MFTLGPKTLSISHKYVEYMKPLPESMLTNHHGILCHSFKTPFSENAHEINMNKEFANYTLLPYLRINESMHSCWYISLLYHWLRTSISMIHNACFLQSCLQMSDQIYFWIHTAKRNIVLLPYCEEIVCLPVNMIQHCWKVLDYFLNFQWWLLSSQLSYMFLTSFNKHRWKYETCVGKTISFLPQHGSITECHKNIHSAFSLPATILDLYFLLSNNEHWTKLPTWYRWHLMFCENIYILIPC